MPQGRRKVPFSTKQKKQQLKEKRERKATRDRGNHFSKYYLCYIKKFL